jgi:TolB-like protein
VNLQNFFAELRRRNVYKVAIAYAVVSWLLVQVASIVFPTFEAPAAAMKILIVLLVVGFPIALGFAWAFEITPEGIKREWEVEADKSIVRRTGRKIVAITVALALAAAALFVFQLLRGKTTMTPRQSEAATGIPEKSIAVLPFDSLSEDKSNAYFADGIQEEILTKLATIADLKVISRTSTAKYKSKPENLKTVSQELGVAKILEGSVQRSGDKVRVNVQLIDARADSHLWAKSYDGDAKDIFAVETEVSQQVADALRAKLSPQEAKTLAKAPTQDPEAYDLFLRAEAQTRTAVAALTADAFDRAVALYAEALHRDPNFALAAARMGEARLWEHWFVNRLDAAQLREVRAPIDHALNIAPDLAAAHVALGTFYYYGEWNLEKAVDEYARALQFQPNNADAFRFRGYIYRRQGKWEESTAELNKAAELDPRDASVWENIAVTYLSLRQWSEAKRMALRSLALEPRSVLAQRVALLVYVNGDGDLDAAAGLAKNMEPGTRLRVVAANGNLGVVIGERPYVAAMQKDFAAALNSWASDSSDASQHRERLAARAAIGVLAGDAANRTGEIEEARSLIEARLRERPDDRAAMTQLSWVYLALGRNDDAIRMAEAAARALPIATDHLAGPIVAAGLAEVQARAGEGKRAIAAIRDLLAIPAGQAISIQRLKLDPVWDPIRNDAEFQQLLAGKEHVGP